MVAVSTRLHLGGPLYADRLIVGIDRPPGGPKMPKDVFPSSASSMHYHPIGQAQPCFCVPMAWLPSRLLAEPPEP